MEFKIELINDIEEVKKQLIFDFNEVEKEKIEIIFDFKKEKYLELEIILCIQLYYEYLTFLFAKSKKRLVIKNMDKIKDYANAMGFLEKIPYNINKNMDYIEKIKDQSLRMEKVDFSRASFQIRELTQLIEKNIYYDKHVNREIMNSIDYIFVELFDNLMIHSKSDIGGIFSVQVFKIKKEIKIVIGDIGLGIVEVLRNAKDEQGIQKYKFENEEEYLIRSLDESIGIQQGNGLYMLKNLVFALGGKLSIHTSKYHLTLDTENDSINVQKTNYHKGTIFVIMLPTETSVTAEDLEIILHERPMEYDDVFGEMF